MAYYCPECGCDAPPMKNLREVKGGRYVANENQWVCKKCSSLWYSEQIIDEFGGGEVAYSLSHEFEKWYSNREEPPEYERED